MNKMNIEDYVPVFPMPNSVDECQKKVSLTLRAMPRSQQISDSQLLYWLAYWCHKLGSSIEVSYFTIEDNGGNGYSKNTFAVIAHLPDGTEINFSYAKPIAAYYRFTKKGDRGNAASLYEARLNDVMRKSIRYQIEIWKKTNTGSGHVDHAFPITFSSLCRRFRLELSAQERYGDSWEDFIDEDKSLEPAYIAVEDGGKENHFANVFVDDEICKRWQKFHQKYARLRWLSDENNSKFGDRDPALYGFHDLPVGTPIITT
ncbi:hypothetical protein [Acidithiobacillus sp. HP-11]|uniref:hypothetical protein n=1 Tax=Acidithiobacillus sp. HP-11 TaxID=2697656 RepID=UPI0018791A28|nr:hypothetical protein [Acidithiobacillus sp. HP-11]MBE7567811.1 hypothetical protein [Acidithiobacillus sp. HP-11]